MSNIVALNVSTDQEVRELLQSVADEQPKEVMVVFMKNGGVHTRSNGTFSRMRTLGALEILKHDLLHGD